MERIYQYINGKLLSKNRLSYFYLYIDCSKCDLLSHFENQLNFIPSGKTDGEYSFNRLKDNKDISSVSINGKEYSVPWNNELDDQYTNIWQTNCIDFRKNSNILTIVIKNTRL